MYEIKKVVIVTPSSLVKNWVKEFAKWLDDRVTAQFVGKHFYIHSFIYYNHLAFSFSHIYAAANNKIGLKNLAQFEFGGELLIISYDQLKIFGDRLGKVKGIGLVICDEGHRLKNSTIQTSIAVEKLKTLRRIVVTGTPVYVN